MTICKEIKVEMDYGLQGSASFCTQSTYRSTKYRWDQVTCSECLNMRAQLKEKHKAQIKQWKEENE